MAKFDSDIQSLIEDLSAPSYITHDYLDIGIPSLIVLSTVFRVNKSYLGNYLGRVLSTRKDLVRDKIVFDLGCGCGLLGIICALRGAKRVHFSDINPQAVKNSRLNAVLLDINNASFSTGSLFDNLPTKPKFDVIVFNPPSITGLPANTTEAALIREDKIITDFYEKLPGSLQKGGIVIMPGSSRFDGEMSPVHMIKRLNLSSEIIHTEQEEGDHKKYVISIKKQ